MNNNLRTVMTYYNNDNESTIIRMDELEHGEEFYLFEYDGNTTKEIGDGWLAVSDPTCINGVWGIEAEPLIEIKSVRLLEQG